MILERLVTSFRWRLLSPTSPQLATSKHKLITLGSKYGRKTFADLFTPGTHPTVVSAGVGEDISFDLEFQALTDAKIILVDPTPAAINHYKEVVVRQGHPRSADYSPSSRQSVENYSLEKVDFSRIEYVAKALWSEITTLPFFEPKDLSRDGSFSLNSIHTFYNKETNSIVVETTTISEIIKQNGISILDILKMDIEGAALEVLEDCFKKRIYPMQILLEIDEFHFPSFRSKLRAKKLFKLLEHHSYDPIARDNCDFLFLRTNSRD